MLQGKPKCQSIVSKRFIIVGFVELAAHVVLYYFSSHSRNKYHLSEDIEILKFLLEKKRYLRQTNGNLIWQQLEQSKVSFVFVHLIAGCLQNK
jgi:hypothetical protein